MDELAPILCELTRCLQHALDHERAIQAMATNFYFAICRQIQVHLRCLHFHSAVRKYPVAECNRFAYQFPKDDGVQVGVRFPDRIASFIEPCFTASQHFQCKVAIALVVDRAMERQRQ